MNKKIEKLIDELVAICDENEVTVAVAAFDETKIGSVAYRGEDDDVKLAIIGIIDEVEKQPCACVLCQASKSAEEVERSQALAIAEILEGAIG